ncbi:MAG: hypothetical protein H7176_09505 [Bdellovibrionales bacterium]|nr:hypothetical protein [Massilia sp.]
MHRIVTIVGAALFATSTAYAHTSRPQTLTYEAITAISPVGISRLRVTELDIGDYALDFSIVAPNKTQHTGHIQGLATKHGNRFILKVPTFQPDGNVDHPFLCRLVVDVNETGAKVVSEQGCAGFSGAAASFFEQGQNLVRMP